MQMSLATSLTQRAKNTALANTALVVLGSLLIALAAQVRIPLPFSPVPVTGQTFAVLLIAAALGSRLGTASVCLYIAQGVTGLPVFAGGGSGAAWLLGPTGGYLAGFVVAAAVVGFLAERGLDRRLGTSLLAFVAGTVVIYIFGALWLSVLVGWKSALAAGVAPFVIGDLIKAVLAGIALPGAWKLVKPSEE